MGAGSSVEEIPGGGTEGYHVLRVSKALIPLFVSNEIGPTSAFVLL